MPSIVPTYRDGCRSEIRRFSMLYSMTYVSSACTPFSKLQLHDLLAVSNRNNKRDAITGMLLYKDGNFMQVLEGDRTSVEQTSERIERDSRHRGVITLLRGELQARQFAGWAMGFQDLTALVGNSPEGYTPFLQSALTDPAFSKNPSAAQKLLLSFRKSM
jgi:Sensors of blue-light using FAD